MPELSFKIADVEAVHRGVTPVLHFKVLVQNTPSEEKIHSIQLNAQIQIQSLHRSYTQEERDRLLDLFGAPERWGQTLRSLFWTNAQVNVPPFRKATEVHLPVQCTFDLNVASAKYFYSLEKGEVDLLFLFSGTLFYSGHDGKLQVGRISWEREANFRLPVRVWWDLMERHFPNSAWLYLQRDLFDRLYEYKRRNGFATWDRTIDTLLPSMEEEELAI